MGPRLDNRGWARKKAPKRVYALGLQWVHGWITVVGRDGFVNPGRFLVASMGPRLDNRGWARKDCVSR